MAVIASIFKEAYTAAIHSITAEETLLSASDGDGLVNGRRYLLLLAVEGVAINATMTTRMRVNAVENSNFRGRWRPPASAPNVDQAQVCHLYTHSTGNTVTFTAERTDVGGGPSLDVFNAKMLFIDLDGSTLAQNLDFYLVEDPSVDSSIPAGMWSSHAHASLAWTPDGTSDYMLIACTKFTPINDSVETPLMRVWDSELGALPESVAGQREYGSTNVTEYQYTVMTVLQAPEHVARVTRVELSGSGNIGHDHTTLFLLRLPFFETSVNEVSDKNANGFSNGAAYGGSPDYTLAYQVDSGGEALWFQMMKWPQELTFNREGHSAKIELPIGSPLYAGNVPAGTERYRQAYINTAPIKTQSQTFRFGKVTGMTPDANEELGTFIRAYDAGRTLRHMTTVIMGTTIPPLEGFATLQSQSQLQGLGGFLLEGAANLSSTSLLEGSLGTLIPPHVLSVVALDSTHIRVTFDTPMLLDGNLTNTGNYVIVPAVGGAPVSATAVAPEGVANPTYVDLTTNEHTDGIQYTCTVSNVRSEDNNVITAPNSGVYAGIGLLPQLASVETKGPNLIRLNFSEEMRLNSALLNVASYVITPITPGAAPLFFTEVITPVGDNFPDWVELPVSEMTDGATYNVAVSTSGPSDRAFNPMDPGANNLNFIGEGEPPDVDSVVAISQNRVDIIFTEVMKDNADIRNPANYAWDGGLSTVDVLDVVGSIVQLVTSDQTPGVLYTLTITSV